MANDKKYVYKKIMDVLANPNLHWIDDGYRLYLFKQTDAPITIFDLVNHKHLTVWYVNGPCAVSASVSGECIMYPHISPLPFNFVLRLFNTKRARLWKAIEKLRATDRCYTYRYEI